jgi:hypothetical protein
MVDSDKYILNKKLRKIFKIFPKITKYGRYISFDK